MARGVAPLRTRTHDPFAMQKVVGSSPIIRSRKPRKRGFLLPVRATGRGSCRRCCPFARPVVRVALRFRHPLASVRRLRVDPEREPRIRVSELVGHVADVIAPGAAERRVRAVGRDVRHDRPRCGAIAAEGAADRPRRPRRLSAIPRQARETRREQRSAFGSRATACSDLGEGRQVKLAGATPTGPLWGSGRHSSTVGRPTLSVTSSVPRSRPSVKYAD